MSVDWDKVDEATLALMQLTRRRSSEAASAAHGMDNWDALDRMFERGWISAPKTKAKAVVVYDDALHKSRELFEHQFGIINDRERNVFRTMATPRSGGALHCECGCGAAVQGRDFVPGHDQKLRIQLEQRVGGLLALRDIIARLEQHAKGGSTQAQLSAAVRDAFAESTDAG